jgi:hypothetical protein
MKKHLVKIWYKTRFGNYLYEGLINEVLNEYGKPIVYPRGIFKKAFGFSLPDRSIISLL